MLKLKVEHKNIIRDFRMKYHEVFYFHHFAAHSLDCLITHTHTRTHMHARTRANTRARAHTHTHTYISQMKHQLDATLCRFYFC